MATGQLFRSKGHFSEFLHHRAGRRQKGDAERRRIALFAGILDLIEFEQLAAAFCILTSDLP